MRTSVGDVISITQYIVNFENWGENFVKMLTVQSLVEYRQHGHFCKGFV